MQENRSASAAGWVGFVVAAGALVCAARAPAQSLTDLVVPAAQGGGYGMVIPVLAAAALLLVVLLLLIFRKFRSASRSDYMISMTLDDVSGLKQKGLLTEEESKKVRQALARQIQHQLADKPRSGGAASLLADPDVRRLQSLAEAKNTAQMPSEMAPADQEVLPQAWQPGAQQDKPAVQPARQRSPDGQEQPTAAREPARDKPVPASAAPQPASRSDAAAGTEAEDVPIPADVLSMYDLGLITAEELENIRNRIRAKRRQSGLD